MYSDHSGVGSVHTNVQALYTRPGLWVILRMPLRMLFYGCIKTHFPERDADKRLPNDAIEHVCLHLVAYFLIISDTINLNVVLLCRLILTTFL